MSSAREAIQFEDWVKHCFDHPVKKPEWYWGDDEDLEFLTPDPTTLAHHLTRLFESPRFLLEDYSKEQVEQGLYYIFGVGSEFIKVARESPDRELLKRMYLSIRTLYSELWSKYCTDHLSHLDRGQQPSSPLNMTCYMLWDLAGLAGPAMFPGEEFLVDPIFEVLEFALGLDSMACQESALHGLGHLKNHHEARVRRIIDEYLERNPDLDPDLEEYALAAREGMIL